MGKRNFVSHSDCSPLYSKKRAAEEGEQEVPAEEEPQEQLKTLEQYFSELKTSKKVVLNEAPARQANEGISEPKEWKNAVVLEKSEEDFYAGKVLLSPLPLPLKKKKTSL